MPEDLKTDTEIRSQLMDIAITDALNSNRANDTLREALMSSLLKKADDMDASELMTAIKDINAISSIENTQKIISIIDNK